MTHQEIMRRLQEIYDTLFPDGQKKVYINTKTMRDYISIGICYGECLDNIREYLLKHSHFDGERIDKEITWYKAEITGKHGKVGRPKRITA